MQTQRMILWIVFSMSLLFLWDAWQRHEGRPSLFGGASQQASAPGGSGGAPAASPADASIPPSMRWIPKGMTVAYLKKAIGSMRATATPAFAPRESAQGYELPFEVVVANAQGEPVFTATIAMWVSPKTPR